MNDFTKEELIILNLDLETRIANAKLLRVPDHVVKLKDKIKSKIDNYCDHESEKASKWNHLGYSIEWKCKHCGEFYR